jgi:putative ABC transport system permease protein
MHIRETFAVAIDALRANKVRAILTCIGVVIGSASIVLVVTVALTSQKYVISQIEAVGSNLVSAEVVQIPDKAQPLSNLMTLADLEAVRAGVPGVTVAAGMSDMGMTTVVNGRERPVRLIGVTEGYQAIRRLLIVRGRYFDSGDMEMRSKVCIITKELSQIVFGKPCRTNAATWGDDLYHHRCFSRARVHLRSV